MPSSSEAAAVGGSVRLLAVTLWALSGCGLALADPPPVAPGLWEVELLTSFSTLRPAATGAAPVVAAAAATAPPSPQRRSYRICIDARRAAAPMIGRAAPERAEVFYDRQSVSGNGSQRGADGRSRPVEFAYRWLDDKRFEGSHDAETPTQVVRTQYLAHWIQADCGALTPQSPQGLGTP